MRGDDGGPGGRFYRGGPHTSTWICVCDAASECVTYATPQVLLMCQDEEAAVECAHKAGEINPGHALVFHALGQVSEVRRDLVGANRLYVAGLQCDPESAPCCISAGAVAASVGDDSTAERLLRLGLRQIPSSARGWAALEKVAARRGNVEVSAASVARRCSSDRQLTRCCSTFFPAWLILEPGFLQESRSAAAKARHLVQYPAPFNFVLLPMAFQVGTFPDPDEILLPGISKAENDPWGLK